MPIVTIGNEFLDALPVHQLLRKDDGWSERAINYNNGQLEWVEQTAPTHLIRRAEPYMDKSKEGSVLELSPAMECFMADLLNKTQGSGGAGMFIDYGHAKHAPGNTLQAMYKHSYCDVLDNIGHADITSHVNFEALAHICTGRSEDVSCHLKEQGAFLSALGGEYRAQYLAGKATTQKQEKEILSGYYRLRDEDKMGSLFKVFGFCNIQGMTLAGF